MTTESNAAKTTAQRAVPLLLLLNLATGVVEAVCFGHLGHVFAAYVTGTVILAGIQLGTGTATALGYYATALAGFACGGALGGRLVRGSSSARTTYRRTVWAEAAILLAAAVAAGVLHIDAGATGCYLVLGLCSLAMGVQFSAMRYLNVPDLLLAAVTGLIHSLVHDSRAGRARPQRTGRRLAAIACLAVGAAAGSTLAAVHVWAALLLAAVLAASSATAGSHRLPREAQEKDPTQPQERERERGGEQEREQQTVAGG